MYHEIARSDSPPCQKQKIDVNFNGGKLTSDAGVVLLQKVDQKLQLTERINTLIRERPDPLLVAHQQEHLLAQRLYSIALGYEDVNDQKSLRKDPALLAAVILRQVPTLPYLYPFTVSAKNWYCIFLLKLLLFFHGNERNDQAVASRASRTR